MARRIVLSIFITAIILSTSALYASEPSMEVISTDPASPAVLEPGQRLYIKFRYNTGGAESVRTWVRPNSTARGCKSHPCGPIRDKEGVYEGYFYYDNNAAEVTGLKLKMKDDKDKHGYIFEDSVPIDIKWKAPNPGKANGYLAANTKLEMLSIDPSCPAVLKPGEKCNIKFRYNAGDAKSVNIRTWPNKEKDGSRPPGSKYSCINRTGSTGEYTYSFHYDEPVSIGEIKFRLTDNDTGRIIIEFAFPVDITWAKDKKVSRQSRAASSISSYIKPSSIAALSKTKPNQFDTIDAQIAKKHAQKYEGVWAYKLKGSKGKPGKTIILQGKRNEQGDLKFSFLHQDIYAGPVFEKCSVDQYRANVYFKLINNVSIMYSLNRNKQSLNGTLYASSTNQQKISLRKLTLPQAIEAIANDYSKINQLKKSLAKTRVELKRSQGQVSEQKTKIVKLAGELNKSRKQTSESKNKYEKLQQEYSRVIKENREEVKAIRQEHEKLTTNLTNAKKSYQELQKRSRASEKRLVAKIELLLKTISKLEDFAKNNAAVIDEFKAGQKKLTQYNQSLEENCLLAGNQNETLKHEIEKLKKDQAESEKVIANLKQMLKKAKKTINVLKQQKSAGQKTEQQEYAGDD